MGQGAITERETLQEDQMVQFCFTEREREGGDAQNVRKGSGCSESGNLYRKGGKMENGVRCKGERTLAAKT